MRLQCLGASLHAGAFLNTFIRRSGRPACVPACRWGELGPRCSTDNARTGSYTLSTAAYLGWKVAGMPLRQLLGLPAFLGFDQDQSG